MSLLHLPDEVIHEVIFFLSGGVSINEGDQNSIGSFILNSSRLENYKALLALSSTCVRLRQTCGVYLFYFVSMVRRSEVDAIMAYPSRMDKWSDRKELHRQVMKEVLDSNFQQCAREELAQLSLCTDDNGDKHFHSRYQRSFSFNHFVNELEVSNESLSNGDLESFPELRCLKVLDMPILSLESQKATLGLKTDMKRLRTRLFSHLPYLSRLSINLETLLASEILHVLPQLVEINLIVDFNSLVPQSSLTSLKDAFGQTHNLKTFTFFVTDPNILQYTEFVEFVRCLLSHGPVQTFNLRLTRKSGLRADAKAWLISAAETTGPKFVDALIASKELASVMIDFDLVSRLLFPHRYAVPARAKSRSNVYFYLIDDSLSVPKLLFRPREIVANLVQAIQALEVDFIYGEVIDQSHLHAIGVMSNLLMYLVSDSHRNSPYMGVKKVSMEKAWSVSDNTLVRHHYESLIFDYDGAEKGSAEKRKLQTKIYRISLQDRHTFSSPRFRKREEYSVMYPEDGTAIPIILPAIELATCDNFWNVEALLTDLDHYCMRERVLSRIWD